MKTHKNTQLSDIFQNNLVSYKAAVICPGHLVDKWVEEAGQISVIEDKKRLEEFVEAVMKEQTYEQLTLF